MRQFFFFPRSNFHCCGDRPDRPFLRNMLIVFKGEERENEWMSEKILYWKVGEERKERVRVNQRVGKGKSESVWAHIGKNLRRVSRWVWVWIVERRLGKLSWFEIRHLTLGFGELCLPFFVTRWHFDYSDLIDVRFWTEIEGKKTFACSQRVE